ncbi:MAG: Holliday junction branch migration protein RuvA [Candidatus Dojkabacteria bacterium]|jgi:Holliday junction DNA helicase RuvA
MITYITGKILKTNIAKDSYVDLITTSGVGYRVNIPNSYICPESGTEYSLYTYLHVREDSQTLYGFEKEDERDFFIELISVSGVGPKIALAVLSNFSRRELEELINDGDARALSKVPGLGLKKAQKIILELRGKIDLNITDRKGGSIIKELKDALKTLGFVGDSLKEKVTLAENILEVNDDIQIEDLIKRVLSE